MEQIFRKYNKAVPRYTSYPPATAFHNRFTKDEFIEHIIHSNDDGPSGISVYIHIPFCTQRCHFCGCNTALHQSEDVVRRYVDCLKKEIREMGRLIDKTRQVTQVSWGGGTPNSIDFGYIAEIMDTLHEVFTFAGFAEIAMECSPAYLDYEDVDKLGVMGFNRVSLGIQDFHQNVLDAINRRAPKHPTGEMLDYLRNKGFKGLNIDLVYGLPLQTVESFEENLRMAVEIKPDRVATFSYAHIPWFNPAQKLMEGNRFPEPAEKLKMLVAAIDYFTGNGYDVIGMDHFALADDELAIAKRNGNLHRNFQGYNTRKTTGQVYAFGASGISQLNACFAQNVKSFGEYMNLIEQEGWAMERGYTLSRNEMLIRDTINEIMCNGYLSFDEMAAKYNLSKGDFFHITGFIPESIEDMLTDHLAILTDESLTVTETGMLVVRNAAVAFDPAFVPGVNQYSKTI
jgi:oxygen-independent coproporphyrinogen-3 oxidase